MAVWFRGIIHQKQQPQGIRGVMINAQVDSIPPVRKGYHHKARQRRVHLSKPKSTPVSRQHFDFRVALVPQILVGNLRDTLRHKVLSYHSVLIHDRELNPRTFQMADLLCQTSFQQKEIHRSMDGSAHANHQHLCDVKFHKGLLEHTSGSGERIERVGHSRISSFLNSTRLYYMCGNDE